MSQSKSGEDGFALDLISRNLARFRDKGIATVAQGLLFIDVAQHGPTYPKAIAERMGITKFVITKIIHELADGRPDRPDTPGRGLVESVVDPDDARYRRVQLTVRGRALARELAVMFDDVNARRELLKNRFKGE